MKKEYKKPELESIEIVTGCMMALSDNLKYSGEEADANKEVLSKKQQGNWGNIWK